MHEHFLVGLRKNLADQILWLAYADWLEDQGDRTAQFVRMSLEFSEGRVASKQSERRLHEFRAVFQAAHTDTRQLLAVYRGSMPVRFRVTQKIARAHPTRDPGACAIGFLETGRLRQGLQLVTESAKTFVVQSLDGGDHRSREPNFEMVAGSEPLEAGVFFEPLWAGSFTGRGIRFRPGSLLTEAIFQPSGPPA